MSEPWFGVSWPRRGPVAPHVQRWWDEGWVDGLELTLEHGFPADPVPPWSSALDTARDAGRLVGHAVLPSPFTPRDAVHEAWLERARPVLDRHRPRWLTDHEGLSRAAGWQAAPLPLPATAPLVRRVRDHLAWMADAFELPTGLENLALAVSPDDARARPDLLFAMLEPDGVLLLDVHNLWCTAVNQGLDPAAYLRRFPLHLVRQLHVAGGRQDPDGFRRDTHDGPIPDEVFALVDEALGTCPALEAVIWERLTDGDADVLRTEARRLAEQVRSTRAAVPPPPVPEVAVFPDVDTDVHAFQRAVRAGDRRALEAETPGFVQDDRAWRVMVEVTGTWGRPVPS